MRFVFLFIAVFILHSPLAWAEDTRGMRTLYNTQDKTNIEDNKSEMRTLNYVRPQTKAEPSRDQKEKDSEAVWKKYKALAAGTPEDENMKHNKSETPEPDESSEAVEPPVSETGFASILSEYKKNKAERAQMKVISVNKPAATENKAP